MSPNYVLKIGHAGTFYPNEPVGYSVVAEHNFSGLPPNGNDPADKCSHTGLLTGCAHRFDSASPPTLIDVAGAPQSPTKCLRMTFPNGHPTGANIGFQLRMWDNTGTAQGTDMREMYISLRFRVFGDGTDFDQADATGTKMLGFWANGGISEDASTYWAFDGTSGLNTTFDIDIIQQEVADRRISANENGEMRINVGDIWHHIEVVATLNDVGQANGTLQMWLDGVRHFNHNDIIWTTTAGKGFNHVNVNPVIGGGAGQGISQEQYCDIDHYYVSGKAL